MSVFVYLDPPEDFSPKVSFVSCFIQAQNHILMIQRNDDKFYGGTWTAPGGKIDENERAIDSLIRETKEETGIILHKEQTVFVKKVYVRNQEFGFDCIHHIFKAVLPNAPQEIVLNKNEHQASAWVTPEQALKLNLIPGQKECLELVYQ